MCRDSSVDTATRYEVECPGIEFRWGRNFSQPSRPALGPTQPPTKLVPGFFPVAKRPGCGVDYPPPLAPRLKTEYSYTSTSGTSWPVLGWTEPLLLPLYVEIASFYLSVRQQGSASKHFVGFPRNSIINSTSCIYIQFEIHKEQIVLPLTALNLIDSTNHINYVSYIIQSRITHCKLNQALYKNKFLDLNGLTK